MKYKWLNKKENKEIIVFFNGWGMDENIILHLNQEMYDILMFYDYNSLYTNFDFSYISKYEKKYLVAWSMGVMVASFFNINYDKKIAINGTLKPIDDNYGIPKKIYNLTIKKFSQTTLRKFIENMFKEKSPLPFINRSYEEQKSELFNLTKYNPNMNFKYDKVIISSEDKVIPTKNQCAFWEMEPNIIAGHAPFNHFKNWSELL